MTNLMLSRVSSRFSLLSQYRAATAAAALCALVFFACGSMPAHGQSVSSFGFQTAVPLTTVSITPVPYGVAVDASGDVYVSDYSNNQVIEIPAGCNSTLCQTVVATGLNNPTGLAVDSSGDLFIANFGANQIIEVPPSCGSSPSSCWTTLSNGVSNPGGVAIDAAGDLFIADEGYGGVAEIPGTCHPLSNTSCWIDIFAGLSTPFGLALDGSGDLYVTDLNGGWVVKIPPGCNDTSCETTIATGLSLPTGVAVDGSRNVFIANSGNNQVVEVPSGCVTSSCWVKVGNGLSAPYGVAVDSSGDVFIGDYGNSRLLEARQNSFNFGTVSVGSTSAPVTAYFNFSAATTLNSTPYQVLTQGVNGLDFVDAGASTCAAASYIAGNSCIVNVDLKPQAPGLVAGAVTLTDNSNNRIATAYISGTGSGPEVTFFTNPVVTTNLGSGLSSPAGLVIDRDKNIFVADTGNKAVDEFLAASSYSESILSTSFISPSDVAVDGAGNVFVADTGDTKVQELLAPAYTTAISLGSGFAGPSSVTVDGAGNVFVADTGNDAVKEIVAPAYTAVKTLNSSFTSPSAVASDANGNLFVADSSLGSVSELTAASGYATLTSLFAGLAQPTGLALDASGNVYVADSGHSAVNEFLAASSYAKSTLSTGFTTPSGVALDAAGNVYVTTPGATNVSELELSTPPTLNFGTVSTGTTTSPQTVTVSNIGSSNLTFPIAAAFDVATQSNGSFKLDDSSTCSTSPLTLGTYCTEAIDFSPVAAQPYTGTFTLTDNNDNTPSPFATQVINLGGTGETINFVTTSLSSGTVGVDLTPQTLQVSGGSGTYTFAAIGLPAGLSLSSAGTLSGTPSAGGTFTGIQVTATDSSDRDKRLKTSSMTIASATITLRLGDVAECNL